MRVAVLAVLLLNRCSSCAAPHPTPEDDPADRDAAPHALEAKPRCSARATLALPGTFELGRVAVTSSRVLIGARRGERLGVLDTDGLTVRFVEVADAVGDAPPPLPVAEKERVVSVEYEGNARHLVLRDVARPNAPIAGLPPELPDDSLAFDAAALQDGSIAVAWDSPDQDTGSAVFAVVVRGGTVMPPVRLSPPDVDADTPRLAAFGPNVVATWLAHKPVPDVQRDDAGLALEAPPQDLEHVWVEMVAFDSTLHATSPLRHLTPEGGRVGSYDLQAERAPPSVTVLARDAVELQAGQGGTALLVRAHGLDVDAPVVLATHVGRGVPLYSHDLLLFDDAEGRGRAVIGGHGSPEPSLDAARPLAVLPSSSDVVVAPEVGTELRIVRCGELP